ncbi:MAG: diguanylate cyclase [Poseidonibacter sp.]|uniref:diguanylate cyclase n=1 Tax=Poseidonibacter sp. TaxID=2321188 RepID=UPI00359E310C
MKLSIKNKIFLLISTFVGAIVFILLSSIFLFQKSNVQQLSIENLEKEKDNKVKFFNKYIENKTILLESIIDNKYIINFAKDKKDKEFVQNLFITLFKTNKDIFQFRYIDINGNETIRVDNYQKPILVEDKYLQNKKGRYYFEDTLKKKSDEVYYSNIDLNVENSKIELPIVPTLRIAKTLIIDNKKMGIIILNINLKTFLEDLQKSSLHDVSLIYEDANIIVSKDSKYNWTSDLKLGKSVFDLYDFLPKDLTKTKLRKSEHFYLSALDISSKDKIYMLLVPKDFNKYNKIYEQSENRIILLIIVTLFGLPIGYLIAGYIEEKYKDKILLDKTTNDNILINSVINSTNDLIFYKDKDFKYIGCNHAFEKLVQKSLAEIIGKTDFELFNKEQAKLFRESDILMLKDNKVKIFNEWFTNTDGSRIYYQTQKIPFDYSLNKNIGILGLARDHTDLHLSQLKIKEQVYIDELTQVFNRKFYNKRVQESLDLFKRYDCNFCLAILDIDNFKNINDTYGHDIGDAVLVKIAKAIKDMIRSTDLLFRIGGEEFVLILPKNDLDNAFIIIEKIREYISTLELVKNEKITVSIGLTKVKKSDSVETLFKRADILMYKSKRSGKNKTSEA